MEAGARRRAEPPPSVFIAFLTRPLAARTAMQVAAAPLMPSAPAPASLLFGS